MPLPSPTDDFDKMKAALELAMNRPLAHAVLFAHRHPARTPEFHHEIIELIHSGLPNVLFLAFRGSAKSTLMEEATVIQACLGEFKNKVILGATRARAIDRLTAIKYEIEYNEKIQYLFGDMKGVTWNEDKIVLSNHVCIQAFGPGQSFRGVKHIEWRPDRLDVDDLEDEETIRDIETRASLRSWLRRVVFPALAPWALTRVYATPLDPDALPMHLQRMENWTHRTYPIYRVTPAGEKEALWPALYPIEWVETKEKEYAADGAAQEFAQEYMCVPEDPATKAFTESMLKVEPRVRTWHAVYATYDPARSVGRKSATTGHCVFSWLGSRLVIWRGGADMWLPDQIIDDIAAVDERYTPVAIGVETTGLVEFIEQPLRQRALKLGRPLPIVHLKPPRGQQDFIRSLQPYFRAGEIEWAGPIDPEARAQLLSFPTGKRDFPNALAYALYMRPGQPVYQEFGRESVMDDLPMVNGEPLWLAVNATPQYTTGVLVQAVHGGLRVLRDWAIEGPPGENLGDIVRAACLETSGSVRVRCPPQHFAEYDTLGLRAAAGHIPIELRATALPTQGREELRSLMTRSRAGTPLLLVSAQARWTLNGLSGGLARAHGRGGMLADEPAMGPYKVLIEGLESFAGALRSVDDKERVAYATSPKGRRYITSLANAEPERPDKTNWHEF